MAIKAKFYWEKPQKIGEFPKISLQLTCNNLFQSDVVNIMLHTDYSDIVWLYKNLKIGAGKSIYITEENTGWPWGKNDSVCIVNDRLEILQEWKVSEFIPPVKNCPSCGESRKCPICHGLKYRTKSRLEWSRFDGSYLDYLDNRNKNRLNVPCATCNATGCCLHCYRPGTAMNRTPVNIQPDYMGPRYSYYSSNRNPLPVGVPNYDAKLKRINEQKQRVAEAQARTAGTIGAGASQTVIGGFQTLENQEVNRLKDML